MGQAANDSYEVAPGGGFCGAGEGVIELGGAGVGETDQAGALHGTKVLGTQCFELCKLAVGSEGTRQHVEALEPLAMFLQELAKAGHDGKLIRPVPRKIDLYASLFIGGVVGTPVHGRSVKPGALHRDLHDSSHADDHKSRAIRGDQQGIGALID